MYRVLTFVDSHYQSCNEYPTEDESHAFARGMRHALGLTGNALKITVYALPEDDETMKAIEDASEIGYAFRMLDP